MYTYKNITENDLVIPGVGFIKAGQTFRSPRLIENPNLETSGEAEPVVGVQEPQANVVTEANLVQPESNNIEGVN